MMSLDRVVGVLAPHQCILCGVEGHVLCPDCAKVSASSLPPRCLGCRKLSNDRKTCNTCKKWLPVYRAYVVTEYDEIQEQLIHAYKFDCRRQAADPIAEIITESATWKETILLCPLPTAPARIRERSFDHTLLLAKKLERKTSHQLCPALRRRSNRRQLGADRAKRIRQMNDEFYIDDPALVKGKHVLLLDDVVTTGASIAAAASALKKAGAKRVDALIYSQKL